MLNTTYLAPLTASRALALAKIVTAAQEGARVVFLDENGEQQNGTARHVVASPENFGFLASDEDVRNGYLRVTMQSGFDLTAKVADLIEDLGQTFYVYDWS